ncbi:MAG: ATP-binding protein [Dehalococcoidia bacterium]
MAVLHAVQRRFHLDERRPLLFCFDDGAVAMVIDLAQASRLAAELLGAEVARMRQRGVPVGEDDLRGLYVSDQEADRILRAAPASKSHDHEASSALIDAVGPRMCRLKEIAGLTTEESAALALCLVAETNPELERLVAYVQDDVSKKRPRVELLLRLFWEDAIAGQSAFDGDANLRALHLIALHDEVGQPASPLLGRSVALDARVARFLLGGDAIDEAVFPYIEQIATPEATVEAPLDPSFFDPPVLVLRGADLEKIRRVAGSIARVKGIEQVLDFNLGLAREGTHREATERAAREAAFSNAALLLRGYDELEAPVRESLAATLSSALAPFVFIVSEAEPTWHGPSITVERPTADERLAEWKTALEGLALEPSAVEALPALAAKFELNTGAILDGAQTAKGLATARSPENAQISLEDLYSAARARSAPILSSLASKVTRHKQWEDLILEPDPIMQLRELCAMVEHKHKVYDEWGFGEKLSSGKGVVALFGGQSGTGKTMAAGVIAGALGLDLYKIDLSGVVSKYIGETEKNLGAIFRDASLSNAILFFDEADALFGKRSEVRDAHDRYANIETAYLLQQIEDYGGPVILSTNLKMNLDEAFLRRMHFVIDFPMPEEPYRLKIWRQTMPQEVPLADDVDFAFLARQFRISGGNIRNIVLASAFLAAQDGDALAMRHLIQATRREFQKLGRMVTEADFGEHMVHLE